MEPITMPPPPRAFTLPPIPDAPVQEGARWRHHRPPSEAVAEWFRTVPLDEEMSHDRYVGGVVLIPQADKVKYRGPDGRIAAERYEDVFTPYMQIGTRVAYARHLAELRGLRYRTAPADVPRSINPESPYFNANMPEGYWWHVVRADDGLVRYLCATYVVQLLQPRSYAAAKRGEDVEPVLEGVSTKQVGGGPDINGLAKAQTGAIGRALGVAGILVVGTGIATAEDMTEYVGAPAQAPELPPTEVPEGAAPPPARTREERLAQLRSHVLALQTRMQEQTPAKWTEFAAWWSERTKVEGWGKWEDVPLEALEGIAQRMASMHEEGVAANAQTEVTA